MVRLQHGATGSLASCTAGNAYVAPQALGFRSSGNPDLGPEKSRNFTLGLEYLYSRYDDDDTFVAVGPGTAAGTNPFLLNGGGTNLRPTDNRIDLHSFRVTAGFQF